MGDANTMIFHTNSICLHSGYCNPEDHNLNQAKGYKICGKPNGTVCESVRFSMVSQIPVMYGAFNPNATMGQLWEFHGSEYSNCELLAVAPYYLRGRY
jgi:hypothetical protein